ncbi:MAG: hypothetical protein J0L62_02765 [Bacteroidetes bacterium]|nr:hypothetical protein [Bacteroidota bacterium]
MDQKRILIVAPDLEVLKAIRFRFSDNRVSLFTADDLATAEKIIISLDPKIEKVFLHRDLSPSDHKEIKDLCHNLGIPSVDFDDTVSGELILRG